ncbi:MAG: DUF4278 domain-containing protein [Synechococcaceae cyanobacterium SM2_3_1]|nr:DUF4278 domain-containing protein [Synechococcaceae cyanobacterium SM2_3_1]
MELTYRGLEFNHISVTEVSPGKVGGKYRGLDWRFRHLSKPPVLQTNLDLMYRGLTYQTHQSTPAAAPDTLVTPIAFTTPEPLSSVEALARVMMLGHQRALKIRQQSMLERSAEEIGLDSTHVAGYWNKIQGKVHPSFRESYDRSHATMS